MNPDFIRESVRRHARVYRLLTRLFPAGFRAEYEGPMVQLFRDQCREALTSPERTEVLILWCRVAGDTSVSLFREYLAALKRRLQRTPSISSNPLTPMNAAPVRRRLPWFWIPALALVGGVAAALIAVRMPDAYRSVSVLSRTEIIQLPNQRPNLPPTPADSVLALVSSDVVVQRVMRTLQEGRSTTNKLARPELSAMQGRGNTFILSATAPRFEEAQAFVASWAHGFVAFCTEKRRNELSNVEAQTVQSILNFQRKFEQAQQAVDDFHRKNNLGPGFATELHQNHTAAVALVTSLQEELRRLSSVSEYSIGSATPGNPAFDLRFEIRKLENRLAVAPTNAVLKAELELKRADLKAFTSLMESARAEQREDLARRMDFAKAAVNKAREAELEGAAAEVESVRLDDEVTRIKRQLEDLTTQQLEMSRYYSDQDSFQIIQAGGGANVPVGPNRPLMIASGIGFGAIAGLLIVLGRSLTRRAAPSHASPLSRAPVS